MRTLARRWRADINGDEAAALMREHGVEEMVPLEDCGADLNLLLGNGQVLSYWASGDWGDARWWAWRA